MWITWGTNKDTENVPFQFVIAIRLRRRSNDKNSDMRATPNALLEYRFQWGNEWLE